MKDKKSMHTSIFVNMENVCSIAQDTALKQENDHTTINELKSENSRQNTKLNTILIISVAMFSMFAPEQIWKFINFVV